MAALALVPMLALPVGATATPASSTQNPQEQEVLRLVNAERAKTGCHTPLHIDPRLEKAAQEHARDMGRHGSSTHIGSDGSTPDQRARTAGYTGTLTASWPGVEAGLHRHAWLLAVGGGDRGLVACQL